MSDKGDNLMEMVANRNFKSYSLACHWKRRSYWKRACF